MPIVMRGRTDEFGRSGGCGGAHIGNEIGNCGVGFVSHAADDWQSAVEYRVCHFGFIKRPQVLQTTATTDDEQGF